MPWLQSDTMNCSTEFTSGVYKDLHQWKQKNKIGMTGEGNLYNSDDSIYI